MKKSFRLLMLPAVFFFLLFVNVNLSSCTKTDTNTVTVRDTTVLTVHDTTVVNDTITRPPSILSLLTGKQWELDTVYNNYTGPGTGTLVYVRGSLTNAENVDNYYSTWTVDGYFWQLENSTYFSSTCSFTGTDSVNYKVVSPVYGTDYGRFLKLTATSLTVYDSTFHAYDVEIVKP